jgi:predicted DsbA family dithiol-disulfide isomerase
MAHISDGLASPLAASASLAFRLVGALRSASLHLARQPADLRTGIAQQPPNVRAVTPSAPETAPLGVVVWSDFCCPWCYLGQHRTAHLRSIGCRVTELPFALHPEWPPTGVAVRDGMFRRIADECESIEMPFEHPARLPSTADALAALVLVRTGWPDAVEALVAACFDAVFSPVAPHGRDLGHPAVLDAIVADVIDPEAAAEVRDAIAAGVARLTIESSTAAAHDAGATGAPAWLIDGRLLVPGVQPIDQLDRWVDRLRTRREPSPAEG